MLVYLGRLSKLTMSVLRLQPRHRMLFRRQLSGCDDSAISSGPRADVRFPSLPESHRSIPIVAGASFFRKMLAFAGPGYR